jgi:hypothetical protein
VGLREVLRVPIQEPFESALGKSLGGLSGDLFHGGKIDIKARAFGPEGAFGNHFSELLSEGAKGIQIVGSQLASCHVQTFPGVRENRLGVLRKGSYHQGVVIAKWLLDPTSGMCPRCGCKMLGKP